jgi:hypothetical protein
MLQENNSYSDKDIKEARYRLWIEGILEWKLDVTQKKLYDFYHGKSEKTIVVNCSRRLGKCIAEGSEVMTPSGPIAIEKLKIGDMVYGYNSDGSISETPITDVLDNGIKEVFEFKNNMNVVAECTKDHVWLFQGYKDNLQEKRIGDAKHRDRIVRKFVQIPGGSIDEPHAYAIGALAGDGCSLQKYNKIHISSESNLIPKYIAKILNTEYVHSGSNNFTWFIGEIIEKNKHAKVTHCNYYNEWIKNKYAHEKIIDLNIIKTWNRQSRLSLLAGLIDTDGSVAVTKDGCLKLSFCSQSKSLMIAFQYLYYSLFQYKAKIIQEKRNKYKNGPMYYINIKNNLFNKMALKELDQYIQTPRKKWKNEYNELLENNTNKDCVGFKIGKSSYKQTYDITIQNDTHLFLMANGLVTHNSYLLTILAIEQCLKKEKSIVKFLQPEVKMIRTNIRPIIQEIFDDAPPEVTPQFKTQDNIYVFPNGSEIQLAGTDNGNYEKLRGGNSDLALVDEAGFCSDLNHIIKYILIPTTTLTRGRIVLSSTTPPIPDHEFNKEMEKAELENRLIRKTILDAVSDGKEIENPRITEEVVADIVKSYTKGKDDEAFRTEYLCEIIRDSDHSVIPEFTAEVEKDCVTTWPRPIFYDRYVAMDIGFQDWTAVLFAYWDFDNAVLVIEDEFLINKMTTSNLADGIKQKEAELWTNKLTGEIEPPYLRFSDNNLIVINDLQQEHQLNFLATEKHNKSAYLNMARNMIQNRQIIINPKCKNLIVHIKNASWNKSKSDFARDPNNGHYDCIDALAYMVRNVDQNKNPYPTGYKYRKLGTAQNYFVNPNTYSETDPKFEGFKKLFTPKSSFKKK